MTVYCLFRQHAPYPWREVKRGIESHGEEVRLGYNNKAISKKDTVLTWNNYGIGARLGQKIYDLGGLHLAFENGYLLPDAFWFAVGLHGISGEDQSYIEEKDNSRWKNFNLKIEPWRKQGHTILVCGQRGGNYNRLSMPNTWPQEIIWKLREISDRKIIYRPHPQRQRLPSSLPANCEIGDPKKSLRSELKEAFICVVWTSSAVLQALLMGVPCIYLGPDHIARDLMYSNLSGIETPFYPSCRQIFFIELAWRQFHLSELSNGFMWETMVRRWQQQEK